MNSGNYVQKSGVDLRGLSQAELDKAEAMGFVEKKYQIGQHYRSRGGREYILNTPMEGYLVLTNVNTGLPIRHAMPCDGMVDRCHRKITAKDFAEVSKGKKLTLIG